MNPLDGLDHLPRNGIELAGLVVLCMVALVMWRQKRVDDNIGRLHTEVRAVRGQVTNGHGDDPDAPKLRDDLDRLKEDMHSVRASLAEWAPLIPIVRSIISDMHGLRAEVRDDLAEERAERRALAHDVREDMARNRAEVHNLTKRITRDHDAG